MNFKHNGVVLSDKELCTLFNDHFSSIPLTIASKLPECRTLPSISCPYVVNSFTFNPILLSEVRDSILYFKDKQFYKYELQPNIVISVMDIVCPIVCSIFNDCITECIFPDSLKFARVVPVFKSGNKNELNNYRPIANLPFFNKIFDRIIFNRISLFLDNENIITGKQFGFEEFIDNSRNTGLLIFYSDSN